MAGVLNVIGFVLGAASLVPFAQELLAPNTADQTNIRVVLGSSVNEADSMGGNTPGASLWDFNGKAIGHTDGSSKIRKQGEHIDIKVNPLDSAGNVQAHYVSISNGGNDAICIAGLSLTFPDGARAGFSTNVAAACGAFWANSFTSVVGTQASGEVETPKCVWIDRDRSNGIPHQGMGIHLPSFSNTNANLGASYTANQDLMCKSGPRFRMYPDLRTEDSILVFQHPLEFITESDDPSLIGTDKDPGFIIENPGILAGDLNGRSIGRRGRSFRRDGGGHGGPTFSNSTLGTNTTLAAPVNGTAGLNGTTTPATGLPRPLAEALIISDFAYNSARELCESATSFGQSFVSTVEQLFCDMTDKTLYFTCGDKAATCCFDTAVESFRACDSGSTRPPVGQGKGVPGPVGRFRRREAGDSLDPAWTKRDKTFDSVQRWS